MQLAWGHVVRVAEERAGLQRLEVIVDGTPQPATAIAYPSLSGLCAVGERVLLNTTAVDLGLGTGGAHFVVARGEPGAVSDPSGGHIMKLRYTPLQRDVLTVEEDASNAHGIMAQARDLGGLPVVCCGLHSQVPLVAAAVKERLPELRVAYLMTDSAALPLAISELVPRMLDAGLLDTTLTCGQAFGGALEAVNLYSGLLAAKHVAQADMAIVAIGPGIPGTATPFGHGGVAQGEALNATAALGGNAIAALRVSFADPRPRHVPVSHQSLTALTAVALRPARVAVPVLDKPYADALDAALEDAGVWERHTQRRVDVALPDLRGVDVRTMGRGVGDDPAFFLAAAAAGAVAVQEMAADQEPLSAAQPPLG